MNDEIVMVKSYPSVSEAQLYKGVLESEGIASQIFSDDAAGWYPQMQNITGVRLMVHRSDLERARELLAGADEQG